MPTDPLAPLGVVPIFVNAGAALAPAIAVSVASAAAILLKPRELLALCQRKPWVPAMALLIGVALWFGIGAMLAGPAQAGADRNITAAAYERTDWMAVANKLLDDEASAAKTTGIRPSWNYLADPRAAIHWALSTAAYGDKTHRVFATATVQDVGEYFGFLYALDADTGQKVWQADKAGDEDLKPFFSSPALSADQKSLVVGQGLHVDENCSLLCFNAETGELRWKVKTPLHIESSPAIRGDITVVGAGAIEGPDRKPRGHAGFVLAVRVSDGKELWRYDLADPESSPAIADDDTVYIGSGFNGNAVVALRPETDEELKAKNLPREIWRAKAPFPITGPVTIDGDLLIVGGGNSDFVYADPNPAGVVMAIDRKTGSIRWQSPMPDSVLNRLAVRNGKVFCPVRNGNVMALNLADGKPAWERAISGSAPILAGVTLSADGQTVFAASNDGQLALLAAADGKLIDRQPINRRDKPPEKNFCFSTPTLAKDKLFIGTETAGLRAFQMIDPTKTNEAR